MKETISQPTLKVEEVDVGCWRCTCHRCTAGIYSSTSGPEIIINDQGSLTKPEFDLFNMMWGQFSSTWSEDLATISISNHDRSMMYVGKGLYASFNCNSERSLVLP